MRQPNHNKNRSRGRGRRQGGNPANRVYDSNGPDVRVRGTAQTIADKYQQLARDAQSSGDGVKAESYFQHAEHYLRIIAAAQAQRQQKLAEQAARNADRSKHQNGQANDQKQPAVSDTPQPADNLSTDRDGSVDGKPAGEDSWQGHQPEFLKKPPVEPQEQDVAKPAARKGGRKKQDTAGKAVAEGQQDASLPQSDPAAS